MNIKRRRGYLIAISAGILLCAWLLSTRERDNRVTLNFRNAPFKEVARSLRSQISQELFFQPGITGLVTINVKNVPAIEALEIIANQANCRWTAIYPLYSTTQSRNGLERLSQLAFHTS